MGMYGKAVVCIQNVYTRGTKIKTFTKGSEYVFIGETCVLNDNGITHIIKDATIDEYWFDEHFKLKENMAITHDQDIILTQDTALNEAQARIAILTEALSHIESLPIALSEDDAYELIQSARNLATETLSQC